LVDVLVLVFVVVIGDGVTMRRWTFGGEAFSRSGGVGTRLSIRLFFLFDISPPPFPDVESIVIP